MTVPYLFIGELVARTDVGFALMVGVPPGTRGNVVSCDDTQFRVKWASDQDFSYSRSEFGTHVVRSSEWKGEVTQPESGKNGDVRVTDGDRPKWEGPYYPDSPAPAKPAHAEEGEKDKLIARLRADIEALARRAAMYEKFYGETKEALALADTQVGRLLRGLDRAERGRR